MASAAAAYDVIVVGLGAMGSAAAYHLASRGQRVLGLDAFTPGHTRGSSHGETRIIRLAYAEHPDYVPLLRRAYALWEALEQAAGAELLRITGGVYVGPPGSELVAGCVRSAQEHDLPHEVLDAAAVRRRFPALRPDDDAVAVSEACAGALFPERCIAAHLRLAAAAGATLEHEQPVQRWTAASSGVEVRTQAARYRADRLILTAGAWMPKLLAGPAAGGARAALRLPLQPERNVVFWFQPRQTPELFDAGRLPVFIWDAGEAGHFYGVPHVEWPGVKVGRHHSGQLCNPDTVSREVTPEDEAPLRAFLAHAIPALDAPVGHGAVCLYTNTPDLHFVVDRHPHLPQVVYAGGFSGHGFKFASVMGEVLADLAITGQATPAAAFLRAARFGIAGG